MSQAVAMRVTLAVVLTLLAGTKAELKRLSCSTALLATGLFNPRGLQYGEGLLGPALYVAEAGLGGNFTTTGPGGLCPQEVPYGPYKGGYTGRISAIDEETGARRTAVPGLGSSNDTMGQIQGPADVYVANGTITVLQIGGCYYGTPNSVNGLLRFRPARSSTSLQSSVSPAFADLELFYRGVPAAANGLPNSDFNPVGSLTNLAVDPASGLTYVLEASRGTLDVVDVRGKVTPVADIDGYLEEKSTPTGIAIDSYGRVYVGTFTSYPYKNGDAQIVRYDPQTRKLERFFRKGYFTNIYAMQFDEDDTLYVVEMSTGNTGRPPYLNPNKGRVSRITPQGIQTVASGLNFPTGITVGPDAYVYVSNNGLGSVSADRAMGQIIQVDPFAACIDAPSVSSASNPL